MSPQESIALIPWVLHLTYVQNVGAAFGLFPGRQPLFILTSALVLFVIAAYWRRVHPTQWPVVIALALVTAGASGNLIDRVVFGQVTDFFEFGFIDFPVFNVADMCILGGVGILMVWILFGPESAGEAQPTAQPVCAEQPETAALEEWTDADVEAPVTAALGIEDDAAGEEIEGSR